MLMEKHGKNVSFTFLVCDNLAFKSILNEHLHSARCHFQVRFEFF